MQRGDGIVQVGLDGFLLPQPGEQVTVEFRGAGGERLGSGRLPDEDDVVDLKDLARPVQDGDRLRITRTRESPNAQLEIELPIC